MVVKGISLGGDPTWGVFGVVASTGLLFMSGHYAHQSVYRVYLTSNNQRIGFQVHTIFGYPGKKYEMQLGNARLVNRKQVQEFSNTNAKISDFQEGKSGFLNSSLIPIQVPTKNTNLVIDRSGLRPGDRRVLDALLFAEKNTATGKEQRKTWHETKVKNKK